MAAHLEMYKSIWKTSIQTFFDTGMLYNGSKWNVFKLKNLRWLSDYTFASSG